MTNQTVTLFRPQVLIPFLLITIIWGSTWIVITGQLGIVPPAWSVAYRFIIAAAAMFIYAAMTDASLRIGRDGHLLAAVFGVPQFCLNFNFVYLAEQHVTSGLVAVVFAMLVVPNSLLAWLFLKQRITGRFAAGSLIAMAGVALLFVQEIRADKGPAGEVLVGIGLTVLGVLSVSVANVIQASERLRNRPLPAMIAWGMAYGVVANILIAWPLYGAPSIEYSFTYLGGLIYLGLFASALAFTLYFAIIRAIGPGPAAYSSVLVPIIAMALSTIFESYIWSTLAVAGGLLVLTGLFIALAARRAAPGP